IAIAVRRWRSCRQQLWRSPVRYPLRGGAVVCWKRSSYLHLCSPAARSLWPRQYSSAEQIESRTFDVASMPPRWIAVLGGPVYTRLYGQCLPSCPVVGNPSIDGWHVNRPPIREAVTV